MYSINYLFSHMSKSCRLWIIIKWHITYAQCPYKLTPLIYYPYLGVVLEAMRFIFLIACNWNYFISDSFFHFVLFFFNFIITHIFFFFAVPFQPFRTASSSLNLWEQMNLYLQAVLLCKVSQWDIETNRINLFSNVFEEYRIWQHVDHW